MGACLNEKSAFDFIFRLTASVNTIFYSLAEETGGNIYITDKPSTPDEMLDFLDEEITLGRLQSCSI